MWLVCKRRNGLVLPRDCRNAAIRASSGGKDWTIKVKGGWEGVGRELGGSWEGSWEGSCL